MSSVVWTSRFNFTCLGIAMKSFASITLIGFVSFFGNVIPERGPEPATAMDKTTTFGGACFECLGLTADDACKPGFLPPCQQKTGFCLKHTFTNLSVNYCKTVAAGTGFKGCRAYTPQVCVRIKTCTGCTAGNPCVNCGPETTEDKTTECSIVPFDFCDPVGG